VPSNDKPADFRDCNAVKPTAGKPAASAGDILWGTLSNYDFGFYGMLCKAATILKMSMKFVISKILGGR
jgi:hypothetical protein